MNDQQFKEIQSTFPWTKRIVMTPACGLVQIIDKNGAEVPLLLIADFLEVITLKLKNKDAQPEAV